MTNTIMTDAEIKAVLDAEYTIVIEEREYTPSFLDSIEDLEAEDNIIPFPSFDFDPTDPASSALAA